MFIAWEAVMSEVAMVSGPVDWRQQIVQRALNGDDAKDRQFDGVVQDHLAGSKLRRADLKSEIIDRVGDRGLAALEKFKDISDENPLKSKILAGHGIVVEEVNKL